MSIQSCGQGRDKSSPAPVPRLAFTIKEATATGLFSRSGLYRAINDGLIRTTMSAGRVVILVDEMNRYVDSLQQRAAS
jgi:hypothetical protein